MNLLSEVLQHVVYSDFRFGLRYLESSLARTRRVAVEAQRRWPLGVGGFRLTLR